MKLTKIWNKEINGKNTYLDFKGTFSYQKQGNVTLYLSCDSTFTAYLNGERVGFGTCDNFKHKKYFYTFNITKYAQDKNELKITVYHPGDDSQTYINQDAYLAFTVKCGKDILIKSDESILCRVNNNYKQGEMKKLTSQLGYSYYFDNTKSELPYQKSVEYGEDNFVKTGIKNLKLFKRVPIKIKETESGYLIDLKKERVGFLDLDIESKEEKEVNISYGEHLVKGKILRILGDRDFSVDVKLKKGRNEYLNTFRRIAGRYLEINSKDIKINYLGVRPVEYPLTVIKKKFDDKLLQKIYDVSVYTLKCCMHTHYEDCPWREQALYTMDSRNQMLCGYHAFKGREFQKASLLLIANSLRRDGLLCICAPSGLDIPIPFFSLVYPVQVYEYVKYTGDNAILKKVGKVIEKIIKTFTSKVEDNGLIASFPYPYWNFYEWNEDSEARDELLLREKAKFIKRYDLILNCMYVYAVSFYDKLFNTKTDVSKTLKAIKDNFYDSERGLYKLSTNNDHSSILGNSLAILIGLGDKKLAEKLKDGKGLVPITLSMNTFFYDALLKIDKNNKDYIMAGIKEKYSYMLKKRATTFWETEMGYQDFEDAGSLCHGWSAMPVYYFDTLLLNN